MATPRGVSTTNCFVVLTVYSPPNGSWNAFGAANSVNNLFPPPYSEVVPEGHVSLSHRYNTEETATDWQAESPTVSLTERLASLQAADADRRADSSTEQLLTTRRRGQQRRATRSAPDISAPASNSSSPLRRGRVSPFPEQREQPTSEHPWPNRQHSRSSPPRTNSTSTLRSTTPSHSVARSVSPIRAPEAVRADRLRRKRMRRRSTPQRLDFSRCQGARHCSGGSTLPRQSIIERNRSVPEFTPFAMSFTPSFQFGTPVRQRSTSAPLPVPVTSFQGTADTDQQQKETRCNTTPSRSPQTAAAKTVKSDKVEYPIAPTMNQFSRSPHQQPTKVSESPFKTPKFSLSKLPPIKDISQRSRDVVKKNFITKVPQVGNEPGDLPSKENTKA